MVVNFAGQSVAAIESLLHSPEEKTKFISIVEIRASRSKGTKCKDDKFTCIYCNGGVLS